MAYLDAGTLHKELHAALEHLKKAKQAKGLPAPGVRAIDVSICQVNKVLTYLDALPLSYLEPPNDTLCDYCKEPAYMHTPGVLAEHQKMYNELPISAQNPIITGRKS